MIVFDSTVLIAHLRDVPDATELVLRAARARRAVASVLSRIEIEGGMRTHERSEVASLFARFRMEAVSDVIASRAAGFMRAYRRSHPAIEIVDYVIAATADVHGAELVTLNVKHFPMFRRLRPAF